MIDTSRCKRTETVVMDCGDQCNSFIVERSEANVLLSAKYSVCDVGINASGDTVLDRIESVDMFPTRDSIEITCFNLWKGRVQRVAVRDGSLQQTIEKVLGEIADGFGLASAECIAAEERAFVKAVLIEHNEWEAWIAEESEGASLPQPSMRVERVFHTLLTSEQEADEDRRLARHME